MPRIVLKPHKARALASRHPWVLDTAIARVEDAPADGDEVELVSAKGKFLGRGLYNSRSRIRVRLYTWNRDEALDRAFWRGRLQQAIALRGLLGYDNPEGAARLVFSEGDGLSGLIVDRYADYLVVQVTSLGLARRLDELTELLAELVRPRGIILRTERAMAKAEGIRLVSREDGGPPPEGAPSADAPPEIRLSDGPHWGRGPDGPILIVDHGLRYGVDLGGGQKTGFYLDQRENRVAAAATMRGRRVLDMFCYSGGFSLAAAALGGAAEVHGYDSSARAVALARINAQTNGVANARFETGEAFEVLQSLRAAGERFDAVILDPPKFARSRRAVDEALRAYHWLNRLGIALLNPEGILVTCSCSGVVSREDFWDVLCGAAQQAGRQLQVLQQRGASPDHPVAVNCPEGEYLKCFLCRAV